MAHQFVVAFMAFFAMMNPVAGLPVFLSLTASDDKRTERRIATRALLLAFGIVTVFAVGGKLIFELFGITLPALRIAGGAVVFLIGFHMLQGQHSSVQHPSPDDQSSAAAQQLSVAVSPLAMPLLAGPGTIATAMNLSAAGGLAAMGVTIAAFAVLCVVTWLLFSYGSPLVTRIGPSALNVTTRLMGLILAVIGAQMLTTGLKGALPGLAG